MKSLFFSLLFASTSILSFAQKAGQEPFSTKALTSETIKNVEVETTGGNIAVSGVSPAEARVDVYIQGNGNRRDNDLSEEEIQKRLDADYDLTIAVNNGKLTAMAKPKRRNMDWKRGLSISFQVYVPQVVSTMLSTSGGNIELTNLSGHQHFTTSGGNLRISQMQGQTKGSTSGGNISVKNSKDKIDLSTSGGNIEAADCTGDLSLSTSGGSLKLSRLNGDVNATTSGGNVEGEDIEGDLRAHTSGGNIELSDLACSLNTSTSGGQIDVALKELKKPVRISNSGGNIRVQLPKGVQADLDLQGRRVRTDNLEAFKGTIKDDVVRGELNGGGASVIVSAASGNVALSFQ